ADGGRYDISPLRHAVHAYMFQQNGSRGRIRFECHDAAALSDPIGELQHIHANIGADVKADLTLAQASAKEFRYLPIVVMPETVELMRIDSKCHSIDFPWHTISSID